jgi:hypothetical protein
VRHTINPLEKLRFLQVAEAEMSELGTSSLDAAACALGGSNAQILSIPERAQPPLCCFSSGLACGEAEEGELCPVCEQPSLERFAEYKRVAWREPDHACTNKAGILNK